MMKLFTESTDISSMIVNSNDIVFNNNDDSEKQTKQSDKLEKVEKADKLIYEKPTQPVK